MIPMTIEHVEAQDGTRIAFGVAGKEGAPAVVLIHGWAQQFTCWRETVARLAAEHRVVVMDLRGHGMSQMPEAPEAYTDTALWAGDVQAVLTGAGVNRPVLVGWSYGARVIAAYLDQFCSAGVSGVVLAGGILAIGAAREDWMVGPASPGLDRDLYTDDLPRRLAATARFVDACTARPLDRRLFAELVGVNMMCPAHVRRGLFDATVDLRPVYAAMGCPGLVIHGREDAVVSCDTGIAAAKLMPRGQFLGYDGVGHAPFLEAPDRFAADVAQFVQSCTG